MLALHEGSVVGLATGYALGRGEPALALLHTTAGLGNAVGAIATARVNRAPLVVVVGQQDRRHLVFEPFLAGRLQGLAGEYPVWSDQPVRAQDVPGAIDRAYHEAATRRGPALVIVPMDDWLAARRRGARGRLAGAGRARGGRRSGGGGRARGVPRGRDVAGARGRRRRPTRAEAWAALVALAERLVAPVFQESFAARAGFPQDHRLFAGFLPADRPRLREKLAPYDAVLVLGAPVFRQSPYAPGRLDRAGTRIAVVGDEPDEVHRSPAELACWRRRRRSAASSRDACRSATPSSPAQFPRRPRRSRPRRASR